MQIQYNQFKDNKVLDDNEQLFKSQNNLVAYNYFK